MAARLTGPMTTLIINNVSCTATFVQYAGLAALTGSQEPVTRMVSGLNAKRDLLVRGVRERTGLTCESFAERLLAEQHVAVLAGTAFGPGGAGHLRLCYATAPEQLERALAAVRTFVGDLTPAPAA